jgi:rhamnosyltransferase
MTAHSVSIVLLTRNGAATLPAVLDALSRQQLRARVEVVAVDSESTDGTVDLLRGRVDQLISIPATTFDHGLTRNLGVERTTGEFIVLLVQDAVPASESWLAALTAPLIADATIAGTFARQRPRPDASAITRHYLERWAGSSGAPRILQIADRGEFELLHPAAQLDRCTFDNVCSCVRRSVWETHRFRSTAIGEDLAWAREVLLAGHRLAYVPEAEVIHSHDRSARYEFARTYVLHRRLYELFRLRTIPTMPALGRAIGSSIGLHLRCLRTEARNSSYARAIALAFAWPVGQYLGALSAARGWKPQRFEGV